MSSSSLEIKKIASLSRLALSSEEEAMYASQLGQILGYIEKLNALDTTGIEPTAHPAPVTDITRPDTARPGLGPEALLPNAPKQAQGQVQVPRVVDAS
jgi:aspartyl-tRNA(Asn)/glutamyl-tRNA(Gln) amidotransferase subunit C